MKVTYRELSFSTHQVKIKIEGFRIDKLLDSGMKEGIFFRNVRHVSPLAITCNVTATDLEHLRKIAKSRYKSLRLSIEVQVIWLMDFFLSRLKFWVRC